MIDEKFLQDEMLSDEELDNLAGGQGDNFEKRDRYFKSLVHENTDINESEFPQRNVGH